MSHRNPDFEVEIRTNDDGRTRGIRLIGAEAPTEKPDPFKSPRVGQFIGTVELRHYV